MLLKSMTTFKIHMIHAQCLSVPKPISNVKYYVPKY